MARSPLHHSDGPTVIEAIKALDSVCDGASSVDGKGFNKFDLGVHEKLIEKALTTGLLDLKEEKTAYNFLKKYKKQLKELGIEFHQIGTIPRAPEDDVDKKVNDRIPEWIAEHHFKTVDDSKKMYYYVDGVYSDKAETVLEAIIEREFPKLTDNKMVQDVIGKVKRRTYMDREAFNSQHVLNVKNGLLDLDTLQLSPHTPECLSTSQLDVLYNPEASAPKIQKFLNEVAQPQDIPLIEEIIGWTLWPDYNVHKAVMLLGPGRNGKGTLMRLVTTFLGKTSVSNVTLQDLTADRFAKADLYGKLANIGGDLPSKDLSDTAAFRSLTGGDDNRAQEKYRSAFSFRNKAKLMFSANVLPRSPDDTYAFYSRWILLEFLKVFDVQKGTGDPGLDDKLQTPEELSGLLNMALAGLARLRKNEWRFSYAKSVEDVEIMYKRNANPVYAFLMDECEPGCATDYIEKTLVSGRFNEYVRKHGLRPLSSTKFGELLKDQTEIPVSTFRPWVAYGDRPMCWQGIRFKPPSPTTDPDNPFWGKDIDYESPPSDGVERNDKQQTQSTPSRVVTTTFPENKKKQSTPSRVKPTPSFPEKELQDKKCREDKGKIGLSATLDGIDCPADLDEQDKAREDHFRDAAAKSTPTRFDVIYQPGGAALEYAPWACNIVKSPIKDKYKGVIGPKICSHGCLYCFNQQGTESDPILKDDIINRLNRDLSKLKKIIKRSERLEFTFVGDLYDPALPEGIARQCLMACKEAGIPFQVLTKGGMKAVRDFDIYGPGDWFGVTLTGRDEWEPGAAPTEDRIAALQEAHGRGIKTWVSFEPVLDPERTLELIKRVDLFVDDIKIGILNPKKHNPKEVKELADRIDWPKFYHEAVALCVRLGRVEGQNFMIKDDLKKAAAKLSTGAEEVKADDLTCSVCGTEIGPGHGSYGDDLCPSCGPAMLVARAAMKAHAGGATISELWEELAARGNRPPRREYLPKMLAKLGCHEEDNWKWEEAGAS